MDLWTDLGYSWSLTWCGVGSREVPDDIRDVQVWVGYCLGLIGAVLSTGDAIGSDYNFMLGYEAARPKCSTYKLPPTQVYYTGLKNQRKLTHCPSKGHHQLEMYPDTMVIAQDMAYEARGSFEGLFSSGIALHTRNALQVLSETLAHPRKFTVIYAKPVGKRLNVKGGTNTTNKIARKNKIPVINLWVEVERTNFIDWLSRQLINRNLEVPTIGEVNASPTTTAVSG